MLFLLALPFPLIAFLGLSAVPSSRIARRISALILFTYLIYLIVRSYPDDLPKSLVYQTSLWMNILFLVYSDHAILNDAYLIHTHRGQGRPVSQMSFFHRLKWSAAIMLNQRGINWSWEIPHLRRSTLPRWSYVGNQFLRLVMYFLANDFLRYLRLSSPGWEDGSNGGFASQGFVLRTYNVVLFFASGAATQLIGFNLLATSTVALGIYDSSDWPSLQGRWSETKSIRKFWGQTWHQLLRRPLQAHGKFVTQDILGLNPKSNLSSYMQLYIAFFLSGICHGAADWAVTKAPRGFYDTVIYYILQAVVITIEDGLIALGKAKGIQRVPAPICYAWVLCWKSVLVPIWADDMTRAGIFIDFPFSLINVFRWLMDK